MFRVIAPTITAVALVIAPVADACSCRRYAPGIEADRAGERVYVEADLIADATVGDPPADFTTLCRTKGRDRQPGDIGRVVTGDRAMTIHRALKGQAPRTIILAGEPTEVTVHGCATMFNSCASNLPSNRCDIVVLKRIAGDRYAAMHFCSVQPLMVSKRGQALFARK